MVIAFLHLLLLSNFHLLTRDSSCGTSLYLDSKGQHNLGQQVLTNESSTMKAPSLMYMSTI